MSYEKWSNTVEGISSLSHLTHAGVPSGLADRILKAAYRQGVKDGADAMLTGDHTLCAVNEENT